MKSRSKTPNLDKMRRVKKDAQTCGDFLEWLTSGRGKDFVVAEMRSGHYRPVRVGTEKILAEYFCIDLAAVEREKSAILSALQEMGDQ